LASFAYWLGWNAPLDDGPAGLQTAVALGGLDQPDRHAVLDRPAGVEQLDLGDDLRANVRRDAREPHQRCLADRVEDRLLDVRGGRFACRGLGHGHYYTN
jgi:hypothetical protein